MIEDMWCCHVTGTDDVIACENWWVAAETAHQINMGARHSYLVTPNDNWPRVWASPAKWDGDRESHKKSLAGNGGDYRWERALARVMYGGDHD